MADSPVPDARVSYCRICVAACGIVVSLDGDGHVVKVRGDPDHPVSRGYVCSKGRGLADWHESPRRLDHPRLRGQRATWDDALDDLAAALQRVVDDGDPNRVGLYVATGTAYDSAATFITARWLRSIGSRAFYSPVTVDNAPLVVAGELVLGHGGMVPMWSPDRPGLILYVGSNPVVSHGYGPGLPDPIRRLRDFRAHGGRIWVLDPRRTETAALADEYVAVRPGADVAVLAAIARELLAEGADPEELERHCRADEVTALRRTLDRFTLARAADAADVPLETLAQLVADIRAHPRRLVAYAGTGVMMGPDGVLVEWLRWVLMILNGSLDRPEGAHFHDGLWARARPHRRDRPPPPGPASRPELPRVARQLPLVSLVDEIEAGNLRAMVMCGGNPISAAPEPDRLRAALASLDALAVIDVDDNELCSLATHVLPAADQLERADVSAFAQVAMESTVQYTAAVVAPGAERRPVWWILGHLARRMGVDVLDGRDPDALTDEDYLRGLLAASPLDTDAVIANGPRGTAVPVEVGWLRDEFLVDGCWNIAPRVLLDRLDSHAPSGDGLVLTTRREMGWNNSVHYGGSTIPVARMHPDDLAARGLVDAARVRLTSAHGSVDVTIAPDEGIRRGVVSVTHGHLSENPGMLTSRYDDVDPLTTMPRVSALPVTVSAVDAI